METRRKSKRIKLDREDDIDGKVSYDILEWFPVLVCQNVFKYLSGKDIIQASGVNKEWYKLTGERQQMRKVKLVGSGPKSRKYLKILMNSKRSYQHIVFRDLESSKDLEPFLPLLAKMSWKSVEISCWWIDQDVFARILQIIEPTIEELSMKLFLGLHEVVESNPNWTFPCLKRLKFDAWTSHPIHHFGRCSSLVKLHWISNQTITPASQRKLIELLHNNHNLQDLSVCGFDELFKESFQFKLKELELFSVDGTEDMIWEFIATQAESLEILIADVFFYHEDMKLVLSMPRISSLTICDFVFQDEPLPVNTTLTSLKLTDECNRLTQIALKTLIRALPNLKHFECFRIKHRAFNFLAQEARELESFTAKHFDVTKLPRKKIFPKLKSFAVKTFHRQLRKPTGQSNFAKLVAKQMESKS